MMYIYTLIAGCNNYKVVTLGYLCLHGHPRIWELFINTLSASRSLWCARADLEYLGTITSHTYTFNDFIFYKGTL